MKKERLHLLLVLLALPLLALAGPRSFQQAKKIAEHQAAQLGIVMDEAAVSHAKSVRSRTISGEIPAYYVFPNGEDKGFTIVSGDDRLPEIVGYASHGTYDSDNMPANYVSFMKAYQEMVEAVEKGDRAAASNLAEVKAFRSEKTARARTVAPLLGEIAWNQGTPYNNMCPIYNGKDRAVTGCVATAMAQVMAYYKHPKQLLEDIPQYTRQWYGNTVTVPAISKEEGVYDWDNMLPVYKSDGYNETQADAVAKLMYHCGAAVKMGYGPQSGANLTPYPLAKYFGYDADMMLDLARSTYTLAEWTQIMDNELAAGRPILYSGSSSSGGHQFVCDGSDANGLYHINWGWGGYQNGYFDVTILNPAKGGIGSGNAPDGYNRGCGMLVGVAPDNGVIDAPLVRMDPIVMVYIEDTSLFELTKSTRNTASDKFSLKIVNWFNNQSQKEFNGYLAFGIKNALGTYEPISQQRSLSLKGVESDGRTYWNKPTFELDYAFPVGTTTIYALYSTDGVTWQKCAYYGMQPFVVNATAQSLSLVQSQLSAEVSAEGELLSGMANSFKVTITNDGDFEYIGGIDIYSGTTSAKPEQATDQLYVCVPAHGSVTRTLELTPAAGDLYLWLSDGDVVLVNGKRFTISASSAPVLSIVKAWTNATSGEYETEKAFYYNSQVKVPRVNDDKVVYSYMIKNDGGTASMKYTIFAYVPTSGAGFAPVYETVRVPGNGATTTISRSFSPSEVGGNTIVSGLWVRNQTNDDFDDLPYTMPEYNMELVGTNRCFTMNPLTMVVYVAGKSTGISSVSTSTSYIRGGKGEIVILSDTSKHLNIYNLNGQKVADADVEAGVQQSVPVTSGIYVVDGKKIVVK